MPKTFAVRTLAHICASLFALSVGAAAHGADPGLAPHAYPLHVTRGARLTVAAAVNGRTVDAVLDSAAEATLVDPAFARELGLAAGDAVTGQGSGAASFEASLVHGVTLSAVGITLTDQTIAVTDLSDVGRRLFGHRLDVILGREIFDAARLSIDIGRRRIQVVSAAAKPPGVHLELTTEHGIETLPVRIEGGEPVRAAFDLGNGNGVLIGKAYAERRHWLDDGRRVGVEPGGGLGGEARRATFVLRSIEIGGRTFHGVTATIDPQPSATDVNIGVTLLRHFLITTDFPAHSLWLYSRPGRAEHRS